MKNNVSFIVVFLFTFYSMRTIASVVDPWLDLKYDIRLNSNYNYFSKLLVYPLSVNDNLNIINGGEKAFKFYIYDSEQKIILTIDSSPYCSSIINIKSFESGKYIVKADNPSESHQFYFFKK